MKQQQDNKRFYDLIWPHAPAVLRMATVLTHNQADAEDLTQEVLLKAFRSLNQFQSGTNPSAWLMTILRNAWIDRSRSRKSKPETPLTDSISDSLASNTTTAEESQWADPEDILSSFADQDVIDALRCLPDDIRWTLLLVDVQGMDHAHAAEVLDIPVGTIKSRAHRGRAMLRALLLAKAQDLGLLPSPSRGNKTLEPPAKIQA